MPWAQPTRPDVRACPRPTTFGREINYDRWTILLGPGIRLVVAPVLQVGSFGVKRQEPLQGPVIHRQLDDGPASTVPAHDVAVLQEVVEQRPRLGARRKRGRGTIAMVVAPV